MINTQFVQIVPDHCDRIVWRGHYYSLPLPSTRDLIERHAKLEWLAAAVEGPEEATPWADSIISCIGDADSATCDEIRQLERQRNAALRALKAERERADAAINALEFFKREITKAQEGRL